ncbi:MAG TPA: alpha/beta fold hydrolase, partial [Polyangiaceae bacterium]|nr:alpha/beta fold hydrolase [Polyangiaceae bacterium]
MEARRFSFDVLGSTTSALSYPASAERRATLPRATLLLAHGAGAPQTHPWMVRIAHAVSARGLDVVTFNFLYAQASRRAPDRNDVLEATFRAAIAAVRTQGEVVASRLFIGGKSMGGRIATQVAAAGGAGALDVAGLVLLGYPLHPPGKPGQRRASHLPNVRAPMLFVQGSRDAFGTPAELGPIVADLGPRTRLFVVEGGDHSLATSKRTGPTLEAT